MNTENAVREFLREHCLRFDKSVCITRVQGGLLNDVWRIVDGDQTAILKATPPYIASAPSISLDDSRFLFEVRALREFASGGTLEMLSTEYVRSPVLIDVFEDERVLLEEDFGDIPDLSAWLKREIPLQTVTGMAAKLGEFVGKLHSTTFEVESLSHSFTNLSVQVMRHRLQYQFVGQAMEERGCLHWEDIDEQACYAGRRFLSQGVCLTMGDLWPRSILMASGGMRVIDWEFCHFGHPAQDVAHLSAHLWILAHSAAFDEERKRFEAFNGHFLTTYLLTVRQLQPYIIETADFDALHRIHFACEILARTVGQFAKNFLFDLPEAHDKKKEAIDHAVSAMTDKALFFSRERCSSVS